MTDAHPSWRLTREEHDLFPAETDTAPAGARARIRIGVAAGNRIPGAVIGILLVLALAVVYTDGALDLWSSVVPSLGFLQRQSDAITAPLSRSGTLAPRQEGRSGEGADATAVRTDSTPRLAAMAADITNANVATTSSFSVNGSAADGAGGVIRRSILLAQAATSGEGEKDIAAADGVAEDNAEAPEDDSIPRNPYTVQHGATRPLDTYGLPRETQQGGLHAAATAASRPPRQPASGPGLAFTAFASIVTMAFVGKRMLRSL